MSDDESTWLDPRTLFESAPCGLLATEEDGTIREANPTFSDWLGFSQSELKGRRFQDLLTMGGRIFHQTHWAPLMQMQGSVAEVKLELVHHQGHTLSMLLNGVRRQIGGRVFQELALFGTTDRDRFEQELIKSRKLAERLLQEKTLAEAALQAAQDELKQAYEGAQRRALFAEQMVAIASHDLKNPLTAIRMASQVLVKAERTPKEHQLFGHIVQSTERAQRMISDLLDLAQARAGRGMGVSPQQIDLQGVTALSVNELRVAFPKALLIHQAGQACAARIDPDRLQQVLGNLVANSVAYGDPTRPITVTSVCDGDEVSVMVHNEGPAIPAHLVATLFEPMTRGTENHADVRSVGLGLFIVREIAQAHGGSVDVISDEQLGTTFTVRFPFVCG